MAKDLITQSVLTDSFRCCGLSYTSTFYSLIVLRGTHFACSLQYNNFAPGYFAGMIYISFLKQQNNKRHDRSFDLKPFTDICHNRETIQDVEPSDEDDEERKKKKEAEKRERKKDADMNKN